jgi:hypothetical protein
MAHIASERLAAVAQNEELLFTDEEFDHIRSCADCFRKWKASFVETNNLAKPDAKK